MSLKSQKIFVVVIALIVVGILVSGCTSQPQGVQTPTSIPPTNTVSLSPTPTEAKTADVNAFFYPSGWMGDIGDIKLDTKSTDAFHSGPDAIKIQYSGSGSEKKGWAGIYWLYPDNNWGTNPDGRDLRGYSNVTFWARGASGDEKAEFKVGGVTGRYPDSIKEPVTTGVVTLTKEWHQYSIDLKGRDLSHVVGGFCWVTSITQNPKGCTIYLDDMVYN